MNRVVVEQYRKRPGGKFYRNVYFTVGNTLISVEDLLTDTDENAVKKAKSLLVKAIEIKKKMNYEQRKKT